MAEEVIPFPEVGVGDSIRDELFHRAAELLVLVQMAGNVVGLGVDGESRGPRGVLGARGVLDEAVR